MAIYLRYVTLHVTLGCNWLHLVKRNTNLVREAIPYTPNKTISKTNLYTLLLEPKATRPKVKMPLASNGKHVLVFFGVSCYLCCFRLQYLHIRKKQPLFVLGLSTPHIGTCFALVAKGSTCFALALLYVFTRTALQETRLVTKCQPFGSKVASFV